MVFCQGLRINRLLAFKRGMTSPFFTDRITLGSGPLQAEISPYGAELCSLRFNGQELLWQGDVESWPRRAPVLFPHCGRTRDRQVRIDGQIWPNQPIHGFAPTSRFHVTAQSAESLTLSLTDSAETRALYPFAFELDVKFELRDGELIQEIACTNQDARPMPVSAGFHPGFQWPLPGAGTKANHIIQFEMDEPNPIALPNADGLMGGDTMPSLVENGVLALSDALFRAGSAIFTQLKSRSLWFGVPGRPGLAIRFTTPFLVLWRWPGPNEAHYLCIEPWAGLPDPAGFDGELISKPGVTRLQPGGTQTWLLALRPEA